MALEDFRLQARLWLLELANCVCPGEPVERLADDADRLKGKIRHGYDDLLRQRHRIESLHERIAEHAQKETALPWQVQSYLQTGNRVGAWRAAMELERVRDMLVHDRVQLRELEQAHRNQLASLEAQRRQLGKMQLELIHVRPDVRAV